MKEKDGNSKKKEKDIEDIMQENDAEVRSKKGRSSIKRLTFGSLLVLLFMLLYIPSLFNWLSASTVSNDILRIGTIEESIHINGLIVRDEELVKAPPFEGRYIAEIGEGEKTPAFACIATVLNSKSDSLLEEMDNINAKIVKARMEMVEKTDFFSEDLVKLDEEIGLRVQDLITSCNSRSFEDIGKNRHEIELIVEKKAEIIGENSTDTYVNSLMQQKEGLQKKLNMNTVQIVSNVSGIVSYIIDGLEQVLKLEKRKTITPAQFDDILAGYRKQQESDGMAHAGKPLAKIIRSMDIYIVAAVETDRLKGLEANDRVKLRINDGNIETEGTIDYIGKTDNGRSTVSIKTNRGADVLSAVREVNADIISKTEEGLKVPLKCLRNFSKDGAKAEIMLISRENVAVMRKVEIVCRDKDFAIIRTPEGEMNETVSLYNFYILNPDRVTEGDIVQK